MRTRFVAAVLALLLSAPPAWAAPKARIVIALPDEPARGFDPVSGWGSGNVPLIQSTLLKRNLRLELEGDLATAWQATDGGRRWVVKLRSDARFSDGKPVTADDVVFTYETMRKAAGTVDLTMLQSVVAHGAAEVVFALTEPRITFLDKLATLGIVPRHAYGPGYAAAPVGSGPYRLLSWTRGQQAILAPNPHWHGGRTAFERVTLLFLQDDAAHAAARSGQVDLAAVPNTLAAELPAGLKRVVARSVDNRGLMFPAVPPGRRTAAGVPIGNAVTADPAVRRAINRVLDRKRLVAGVLGGFGTPAFGVADGLPWDNTEQRLPDADLAGARDELARAGWRAGADGLLRKGGLEGRLTLVYPSSDTTRQALAVASADMIRPLGLEVRVLGKSWDDIARLMHSEVILFGWGSHDADEVARLYASGQAGRGYYNPGHYTNVAVDAHLLRALAAPTVAESLPHWQRAAWDGGTGYGMKGDAAWAWLVNVDHVYFVNPCLDTGERQVEPHGHGWGVLWNLPQWRWSCS